MQIKNLTLGAILIALATAFTSVAAQTFPARTIEIIVPFAPGGIADILPRVLAPKLSAELKQSIVILNRPGASGNLGTAQFTRDAPDGYTLLETPLSTLSVNAALFGKSLPYDPVKDLEPVAPMATLPLFLVTNSSLPVNNLAELVAYIKAHPGKMSYASAGVGGSNHLAGEMFRFAAGLDVTHVPFSGSAPALNAVLGKYVDYMFDSGRVLPYVKSGMLKLIAVTTPQRLPEFPKVPTMAETYPGFVASGWHGIVAPAGTPRDVVLILNKAIGQALQDPEVKKQLAAQALVPFIASPEEFTVFINEETKKWSDVIHKSGAKAE